MNHPDHVVLFSCTTLDAMLTRHGWAPFEHQVYVQQVKIDRPARRPGRFLAGGAKVLLGLERLLARLRRPYAADGLIVVSRASARP